MMLRAQCCLEECELIMIINMLMPAPVIDLHI
jgi:hypothetical protein